MLVFIDESGDPGLKLASGSSSIFVICLIIFNNLESAQVADDDIAGFRRQLGFNRKSEFKFNKLSNDLRREFLKRAAKYQFQYYGIVINKAKISGEGRQHKSDFYRYACSLLFKSARENLRDAIVVIDGNGDREFQRELGTYLKTQTNSETVSCIKKVKMESSHSNNLIQLADMVSGAIYRSQKVGDADSSFRSLIKSLEISVQLWPK